MQNQPPVPSSKVFIRKRYIIAAAFLLLLAVIAVVLFSTPRRPALPCNASTLQIGETRLLIQTLAHKAGEALSVPPSKPNVAFWVEGTNAHYVFGLSPTGQNIALDEKFAVGDPIKIQWGDCSSDEYVVSALSKDVPQEAALLDQSHGGISVFVPKTASAGGWLVEGRRPEMLTPQAAEPTDANAIQAEISFLEQSVSTDGKTLTLKISIKNTGAKVIHVTQNEISLTAADGAPAAPVTIEPALSSDIQPGQSQTLMLTFPKPAGNVATFKLLDFSVDLYY